MMAECLVRRVDKVNSDPLLDPKCTKAGDIITVQDDGWPWGTDEVDSSTYDIVKLPLIAKEDIEYVTRPEALPETNLYAQKRAIKLDVGALPPRLVPDWVGNRVTLSISLVVFKASLITKQPLNDPNVI